MKQHEVTVPQIGLIAGTRAMLGAGIALLLSEKLSAFGCHARVDSDIDIDNQLLLKVL